uniref:Uncharacterized protein n=1 Tax=Tanacetum cinerariifolium TaxID=118510 RepID=A0A699K1W3_TANCI|nr:hypothetical protein [Tanacetum cinerariifolium]
MNFEGVVVSALYRVETLGAQVLCLEWWPKVVKGSAIYGSDELNLMAKGGDGGAWVAARWRSGEGGGKVMVLEMIDILQALSNLHYLFGGFLDYLWFYELSISNFGLTDWRSALLTIKCLE